MNYPDCSEQKNCRRKSCCPWSAKTPYKSRQWNLQSKSVPGLQQMPNLRSFKMAEAAKLAQGLKYCRQWPASYMYIFIINPFIISEFRYFSVSLQERRVFYYLYLYSRGILLQWGRHYYENQQCYFRPETRISVGNKEPFSFLCSSWRPFSRGKLRSGSRQIRV